MGLSSPGIGSGLDVAGLVDKMMQIERVPLTALDQKEAATQVKISAYGALRGALSTFSSAVSGLSDPARFSAVRASVATSTVASASASSGAAAGTYSLEVTKLATAHRVNSTAFTNTTDVVGTGTITIQFGTYDADANTFSGNSAKATKVLAIDSAHNTLSGIRDAINAASLGVHANIVNDGTGNRLVLGSNDTGAANSMRISVVDDDGTDTNASGLSKLAFDPTAAVGSGKNMQELITAQDATMKLDGMLVTKSSNTVSDAIEGVTLQLTGTNVGAPTTLTVSQDSGVAQAAVAGFVKSYNDLHKATADMLKSDPTNKQLGALQGDVTLRSIQSSLSSALSSSIAGLSGSYVALPQIGLSFDRNGVLTLDNTKFQAALSKDPNSVARLFTATGTPTDSQVGYVGSSSHSQPGIYALTVGQVPTQGSVTASAPAGLTIDGTNDSLTLSVDGVSTSLTLAHATYLTASALAGALQSQINGANALSAAGSSVSVSQSGGNLSITSNTYGSSSSVVVSGGSAVTNLFGAAAPTAVTGVDASGSLGGIAAVGSGKNLTGGGGNGAEGLTVQINGGGTGARGSVQYSQGIAARLTSMLDRMLDSKGAINARTTSLQQSVTLIGKERDHLNEHLAVVQQRYQTQFGSLDQILTGLNSTSAYLTQQLANLPK